jgi:hypothetical protein
MLSFVPHASVSNRDSLKSQMLPTISTCSIPQFKECIGQSLPMVRSAGFLTGVGVLVSFMFCYRYPYKCE